MAGSGQRKESRIAVIYITQGKRCIEWDSGKRVLSQLWCNARPCDQNARSNKTEYGARGVMGARWPVQLEGAGSNPVGSTVSQSGKGADPGDSGQGVLW